MLDNQHGSSAENLVSQMREAREANNPEPEERPTGGTDDDGLEPDSSGVDTDPDQYDDPDPDDPGDGGEYDPEYDPGDDPDPADPEPQRYRVKVDGKEVEVDQDELISGYQRDSDYRKKTMELAEKRKTLEAKEAELSQKVQELESFIEQQNQNIDWDELRETDPSEYLRMKEVDAKRREAAEKAKKEQAENRQAKMQETAQQEAQKLVEAMGGDKKWSQEQQTKDIQAAMSHLQSVGLSEQEAANILDHRFWRIAMDAAKYQKLMQNKGKVSKQVKQAPKSVKPGQRQVPAQRAAKEAVEKLKGSTKHNQTQALVEAMKSTRRGK